MKSWYRRKPCVRVSVGAADKLIETMRELKTTTIEWISNGVYLSQGRDIGTLQHSPKIEILGQGTVISVDLVVVEFLCSEEIDVGARVLCNEEHQFRHLHFQPLEL